MKTVSDIEARVIDVLVTTFELDADEVTPNAHLYKDLDLDSLDAIDLAVKLNSETGIKLKEQEMKSIRTVTDIVNIIAKNLNISPVTSN
jgi:acyl carrier protein